MLDKVGAENDGSLVPPIDIHWIWHTHMLSPQKYARDCEELFLGKVFHHKFSGNLAAGRKAAKSVWMDVNPEEPFDLDYETAHVRYAEAVADFESPFEYNILEAALRQKEFYYQVLAITTIQH